MGNTTTLTIVKASSSVVIEKEEAAFPFGSLLADVGGVLGLFLGFNFLMIWEFVIVCIRKGPANCQKCEKLKKFNILI